MRELMKKPWFNWVTTGLGVAGIGLPLAMQTFPKYASALGGALLFVTRVQHLFTSASPTSETDKKDS